jgi:proteasome lid subunit RPN8/RPN11
MEPKQLFRIMLYLDKMGLQILAFFHSHPEGGSGMLSERDVREHHYPDAQSVVLVAEHGRLISLRVFQLSDKATKEFPIQIRGG